jgi:predicted DNA-binding protein YlxM (UPF0122 family)
MKKTPDGAENYSLLYDFYGELLPERQKTVFGAYYDEDLSLGEIAESAGISRQGVHDALRKAKAALIRYEETLGLIAKHKEFLVALKKVATIAEELQEKGAADADTKKKLNQIKKTIEKLDI